MWTRAVVVASAAAVAFSGCGAEEASVVKSAFSKKIDSANVAINLSMTTDQGQGTTISLAGPYKSNGEGKLPSADLKLNLTGVGSQPLRAELFSTGDNAFVVYGGQTYEVGQKNVAKLQLGGGGPSATDMSKLMSRMQDWFPQTDTQQDVTAGGEPVTRLSGKLDLSAALKDLKQMAKEPGVSGFEGLKQLSNGDLKQLDKAVSDPRFAIDVAKSDGKLRRILASMNVNSEGQKGTVKFSVTFSDVDKPVTINAPSSGKPIDQLFKKLGQAFGGGGFAARRLGLHDQLAAFRQAESLGARPVL